MCFVANAPKPVDTPYAGTDASASRSTVARDCWIASSASGSIVTAASSRATATTCSGATGPMPISTLALLMTRPLPFFVNCVDGARGSAVRRTTATVPGPLTVSVAPPRDWSTSWRSKLLCSPSDDVIAKSPVSATSTSRSAISAGKTPPGARVRTSTLARTRPRRVITFRSRVGPAGNWHVGKLSPANPKGWCGSRA